jgi:hypothetical protein
MRLEVFTCFILAREWLDYYVTFGSNSYYKGKLIDAPSI